MSRDAETPTGEDAIDRLAAALDRDGPDLDAWPGDRAVAALSLIAADDRAATLHAAALAAQGALIAPLTDDLPDSVVAARLADAVLTQADRAPGGARATSPALPLGLSLLAGGAFAAVGAAVFAIGFEIGTADTLGLVVGGFGGPSSGLDLF